MTWVLTDDNGSTREFQSRAKAEETKTELEGLGADIDLEQKGVEEVDAEVVEMSEQNEGSNSDTNDDEPLPGVDICAHCGNDIEDGHCPDCDGPLTNDDLETDHEVADAVNTANELARAQEKPQQEPESNGETELEGTPDVSEDPINWMPEHFVDIIEGVPAINRKGYAVLAEHYDISVRSEPVTFPGESDWEYAEFRATAVTPDGDEYTGYGSAHVDRGDDKTVLGELAETRACKRAVAWSTGVGMTAVQEMKGMQEVVE